LIVAGLIWLLKKYQLLGKEILKINEAIETVKVVMRK